MNAPREGRRVRGFSVIEVMMALAIVSISMLGIAKMLALAISDTGLAAYRSLASIEVASLASAMRVNHAYWRTGAVPSRIEIDGTQVDDPSGTFGGAPVDCTAAPCTPAQLANADLLLWIDDVHRQLPGDRATLACALDADYRTMCTITLTWTEKLLDPRQLDAPGAALPAPTTTLEVRP